MDKFAKHVWNVLISAGMTQAGAAGMMGNMQAESGLRPDRVEILCLQRLREAGRLYTDATYTAFVDDGTINRENFLHPLPGKQYGYGLCQWTSPGRKAGLYDLARSEKVSIGDGSMQIRYLISELKTAYKPVWAVLTRTNSVQEAAETVLKQFEIPADVSSKVIAVRTKYSQNFYDEFAKEGNTIVAKMTAEACIHALISAAEKEVGYLEKRSNSQLDDKTANAGSGNYTKYWRDVYPAFQGQAWCACFVSWIFQKVFGKDTAGKLLKHWPFVYCPTLAGVTKSRTPQVGSVVLFFRNGQYTHTGFIVSMTRTTITTIEGNTSGASGIIPNGGGVCKKTYTIANLSYNTKYFMPDYSIVTRILTAPKESAAITKSDAKATPKAESAAKEIRAEYGAESGPDKALAGVYRITATSGLNLRNCAGTTGERCRIIGTLPYRTKVMNYGYYTMVNGKRWLYVQVKYKGVTYTGHCSEAYLKKVE